MFRRLHTFERSLTKPRRRFGAPGDVVQAFSLALVLAGCSSPSDPPVDGGSESTGGMVGVGTEKSACRAHVDCNAEGTDEPHLCLDGRCVRMRNDDPSDPTRGGTCLDVLGKEHLATGAEPFVFGAFTRISPGQTVPRAPAMNYELAIREFAAAGGVTIGGETRVPMAVLCDELGFQTRDLDHLVHTLGVPAVITTLEEEALKRSFEHVHRDPETNVLFLSAFASDASLVALEDRGLLWHLLGSPDDLAPVFASLIERVEAYLKRTRELGEIRVALIDSETSFEADLGALLHEQLRFNGKTATENGPERYLRLRIPGEENFVDVFEEIAESYVPKVVELMPHVVVFTGRHEAVLMLTLIEFAWPAESSEPPPFYVLGPDFGSFEQLTSAVRAFELHHRIAGVGHAAADDSASYDEYLSALKALFPETYVEKTENFYDAAYYLVYSAVAAGDDWPLDGAKMALGLKRLLQGAPHFVGGRHIPDVTEALRTEPSIALHGTMGPPAFDPETGAWRGNGSVYCIRPGETWNEVVARDVLRYDRETGELHGTFPCIEGF